MPTRTDVTVVNQAYETSGNGGRKLVRLSNGWLVAVVNQGTTGGTAGKLAWYKSTDNGQTWSLLTQSVTTWNCSPAMTCVGTRIYTIIAGTSGTIVALYNFDATTVGSTFDSYTNIDSGQNGFGIGLTLIVNEAGTELHAAWASKNSTYPNSFNIRYAKGTINGDGSVTWGAVEQVTNVNFTTSWFQNPTIIVKDNIPYIATEYRSSGSYYGITILTKNFTTKDTDGDVNYLDGYVKADWGSKVIYNGSGYIQSYPSACVAPNGRIWVAWQGTDATDNSALNIRVAYSDDGGVTWSTPTKLTSGNSYSQSNPSITVNKNNEVFILWWGNDGADSYTDIRMIKYNGSWGSIITVSAGTTNGKLHPSALVDTTLDFSTPLFIYVQSSTKVGFYGTWVVTTISVPQGHIGQKTSADKSNILSYSITTDGTMSTITEKINGVTIATRTNPTSGQQFTVNLNQTQWDTIQYGNAHTLTIEMGSDTWTYTFDKRLNANDDVLSAVKGVQDLQTHLNGIKAQLGEAIRAKGGTVNDTDPFSAFVSALNGLQTKRWASGTVTSSSNIVSYSHIIGSGYTTVAEVTVNGLNFKPSMIIVFRQTVQSNQFAGFTLYSSVPVFTDVPKEQAFCGDLDGGSNSRSQYGFDVTGKVTSTGFTLPYKYTNTSVYWIAYE